MAAAAHYHRPARAAAVLKRRRPTRRRRWVPPSALFCTDALRFPPLVAFFFPIHQTCSRPVLDANHSLKRNEQSEATQGMIIMQYSIATAFVGLGGRCKRTRQLSSLTTHENPHCCLILQVPGQTEPKRLHSTLTKSPPDPRSCNFTWMPPTITSLIHLGYHLGGSGEVN